jgi:hypothetical protein
MKAAKTTVSIAREVIHTGQHCHAACVGKQDYFCGFFRELLSHDRRTFARTIRCRQCREATKRRNV